jgi:hypothetical protein
MKLWKKFKAKSKFRKTFLKNMGLSVHRDTNGSYPMCYGSEHGWLLWAPGWVKGVVCHIWNKTNCLIYGHDLLEVECFKTHTWPGAPHCLHCLAPLLVDGRYPTPEEIAENNRIVHEDWDKPDLSETPE